MAHISGAQMSGCNYRALMSGCICRGANVGSQMSDHKCRGANVVVHISGAQVSLRNSEITKPHPFIYLATAYTLVLPCLLLAFPLAVPLSM